MKVQNPILSGKTCPYCGRDSEFVDSEVIYGTSYGMIYLCRNCDAYCGVHAGTKHALGRLANRELRELKKLAHSAFDPIWKGRYMSRTQAYLRLSAAMKLHVNLTHIGMFNEEQCRQVIRICKKYLNTVYHD